MVALKVGYSVLSRSRLVRLLIGSRLSKKYAMMGCDRASSSMLLACASTPALVSNVPEPAVAVKVASGEVPQNRYDRRVAIS